MPQRLPPSCIEDRDRHGNVRIYYRRKGFRKVRLYGTPWTPEFMADYDAAKKIAAPTQTVRARPTLPETWSWLCLHYFADCTDYKRLDRRTQYVRRQILEATFEEPIRPNSDKRFADMRLAKMNAQAIEVCATGNYRHLSPPMAESKQCGRCSNGPSRKDIRPSMQRARLHISSPAPKASTLGLWRKSSNSRNVTR